jgi:hypothetical protein
MGIKIIRMRHRTAPEVNGCRWCGVDDRAHGQYWIPGKGWHGFIAPTNAQRKARYKARSNQVKIPTIITNLASDARTRL